MSTIWSTKAQSPELLYYTREERFNGENKDEYFNLLQVKDGMKILEVGCGGGLFCNMIKKYFPNCEVTGTDLDENHIKFATKKAKGLGLKVNYQVADINNLPFKDESFDLVFSHTVVEHLPFDNFIKEQKRVLKAGGNVVITYVQTGGAKDAPYSEFESEINACYKKLKFTSGDVSTGQYAESPNITMQKLNSYNFTNINLSFNRIVYYNPDCALNEQIAINQIDRNFNAKYYLTLFNLQLATNGNDVKKDLLNLIKKQHTARLKLLKSGQKIFDYQSTNLITISATKK